MKKFIITVSAILLGLAAVSCIDSNYKGNDVNTDADVTVKVNEELPVVDAEEFMNIKKSEKDANGTIIVKSDASSLEAKSVCSAADLSKGLSEITIPGDIKVNIPLADYFNSADIYAALLAPYFKIDINNSNGIPFVLKGEIDGGTYSAKFSANVPAAKGSYSIFVSKAGKSAPEGSFNINADPVSDFVSIFNGNPKFVTIKNMTVQGATKAGDDLENVTYQIEASAVFPLEMQEGKSFTVRRTVDISGVDWADYANAKKAKVVVELEHNLPFTFEATLIDPTNVTVTCPIIEAAPYPQYSKKQYTVGAQSQKSISEFKEVTFDVKVTLGDNATEFAVKDDMTVKLTIVELKITAEL